MCYSAMVKQHAKKLGLQFQARVQLDLYDDLFKRRANGEKLYLSEAMESNFWEPETREEKNIKKNIEKYRGDKISALEEDLFKQKKRLADAERKLKDKPTKTAEKEQGVASRKIEKIKEDLKSLKSDPDPSHGRIFSLGYAPLVVSENGKNVIKPMRYLCRPSYADEDWDREKSGCYNARRDNLTKFWRNQFLKNHGVLVVTSFYENVQLHNFEHRKLKKGEEEKNIVIQFKPDGFEEMYIPCIWDKWEGPNGEELLSFALITDDPPKEVLEAGHDRCPIFLKKENIDKWLNPNGMSEKEIQAILDDKEKPFYAAKKAA